MDSLSDEGLLAGQVATQKTEGHVGPGGHGPHADSGDATFSEAGQHGVQKLFLGDTGRPRGCHDVVPFA